MRWSPYTICQRRAHPTKHESIITCLSAMAFESPKITLEPYLAKLAERGGIVEERITGVEFRSPSVQLRATPDGVVEFLSTHDQLLGGPSGQSYLGCRFPADIDYAPMISAEANVIGQRLAREGVLGRFAVDFVTVRDHDGAWSAYAIELNLRKGGTTHPFLTLQFLTDGRYDAESGRYVTAEGREKRLGREPITSNRTVSARWRWTISSTSWPATGSTSTRPARSGSCST